MNKINFLNGWAGIGAYTTRRSAQSFMGANQMAFAASGCGSSCGSGEDTPKPASACGVGEDDPKPASACGSGDGK